jgi:hypothetical protein
VDFYVLPCAWFDPLWLSNPMGIHNYRDFFQKKDLSCLMPFVFRNAIAIHWHNQWTAPIEKGS